MGSKDTDEVALREADSDRRKSEREAGGDDDDESKAFQRGLMA